MAKLVFWVESAISIQPSSHAKLDFSQLRRWLLLIVIRYKLSIHTINFDGYHPVEMAQAFRSTSIPTRLISLDRTPEPYDYPRDTHYEGRIAIVESERLHYELNQLEWDQRQNKVDH